MSPKDIIPRDDIYYRKVLRTLKLVVQMVLTILVVLIIGLLIVWLFDKAGNSFLTHSWRLAIWIIIAVLAAVIWIPEYIMDLRKINQGEEARIAKTKSKAYAACLDHARKENLIDEDNQLKVPRADFVRFCIKNNYFSPHRKENWKDIDGILKDSNGMPVSADKLTQSFQDIQSREGFQSN